MSPPPFSYERMEKAWIRCPLCASEAFDSLASQDRYGMGLHTAACRTCGLIMTNPAPTPPALAEFYRFHYRNIYRRVDRPSPKYIRKYGLHRRAEYTATYLTEKNLIRPRARVLDIGCAEGSLLKEIRRRFPDAIRVGVEPGETFAEFCRSHAGSEVFSTLQQLTERQSGPFDCIIAIHVLEHADDPVRFLRDLRPILAPDGALFVDVPDAGAYGSLSDLHLAHLFHFSPRTLAEAACKAGFRVIEMVRHRPPRHPPSIRCVLRTSGDEGPIPHVDGEDRLIQDRIVAIGRKVFLYRLKSSFPVRVLSGGLRRIASLFRRENFPDP